MISINQSLIRLLSQKAKASPRLRANYNFHTEFSDPINRMLNAMEPGTYVQPHKHENPDKREAFIILSGEVAVITFSNDGAPRECQILSAGGDCVGVEIPAGTFHTLVVLKSGTVCYELKDGPYDLLTDKQFAHWAPKEGDAACQAYLNGLLQWINAMK